MAFPSPSLEPPVLENFQWQYNGLTMGANTAWGVLGADGLDLAEIRSGDVNWSRDHGQAMGLDLYAGRDVILDLWMKSDGTSLQHAQLALAAATIVRPNEELPLWFQLPNLPLLCVMCRPRKRPMKVDADYAAAQVGKPELVLHATDPRIYTAGKSTALPPTHPSVTVTITNAGNTEMRPIVVFNGPITRPSVADTSIVGEPKIELRNPAVQEAREKVESEKHVIWLKEQEEAKITKAEREAKEAALKTELVKKEEEEAEKTEQPTVKEGDQILLDLGTPHRVLYYPGGIVANKPENIARWVVFGSTWWDVVAGENAIKFAVFDNPPAWKAATEYKKGAVVVEGGVFYVCIKTMTAGEDVKPPEATHWKVIPSSAIEWASAYEL